MVDFVRNDDPHSLSRMVRGPVERTSAAAAVRAHPASGRRAAVHAGHGRNWASSSFLRRPGPRRRSGPVPRPPRPSRRPAGFLVSKRPPLSQSAPAAFGDGAVGPAPAPHPIAGLRPMASVDPSVPRWQVCRQDSRGVVARLPSGRAPARLSPDRRALATARLATVAHGLGWLLGALGFGNAETPHLLRPTSYMDGRSRQVTARKHLSTQSRQEVRGDNQDECARRSG